MNLEKKKIIKDYILQGLELLILPFICYILFESIKFGSIVSYMKLFFLLLSVAPQYIYTSYLIIVGITMIIRGITRSNFMCNCTTSILLLCITLVSYYKYEILQQHFVPYDIMLIGNINQIANFGFTGISLYMLFSILAVILLFIIYFIINNKHNTKINITVIQRVILFVSGIVIIFITCISPNRYENFKIKNDNGDMYDWMGANAVFFMHLGDFYNPKPVRIQRRSNSKYKK